MYKLLHTREGASKQVRKQASKQAGRQVFKESIYLSIMYACTYVRCREVDLYVGRQTGRRLLLAAFFNAMSKASVLKCPDAIDV